MQDIQFLVVTGIHKTGSTLQTKPVLIEQCFYRKYVTNVDTYNTVKDFSQTKRGRECKHLVVMNTSGGDPSSHRTITEILCRCVHTVVQMATARALVVAP